MPLPFHSTALRKANWVSALQGVFSVCRRWAAANTFPFKAHSIAFFTPQLSPWLLFSKSKSPRLFFSISHYRVSVLSSQPFSNVQLKRKMFHFRPNSPLLSLSHLFSFAPLFSLEEEQSHSNQEAEELHVYFPLGPQSLLVWLDLIEV